MCLFGFIANNKWCDILNTIYYIFLFVWSLYHSNITKVVMEIRFYFIILVYGSVYYNGNGDKILFYYTCV
jgi:hypothetical protein